MKKKKHFRTDKITFLELVEILRPMKSPDMNSLNYRSLSTEKKIAEKNFTKHTSHM